LELEGKLIWQFALLITYIIKYLFYLLCDPNIFSRGVIEIEPTRNKVIERGEYITIRMSEGIYGKQKIIFADQIWREKTLDNLVVYGGGTEGRFRPN
jgi:hypothetical protein